MQQLVPRKLLNKNRLFPILVWGDIIICEYCGVVVHSGRDSCQNCGARVYSSPLYRDQQSANAYVYSTLFKDEKHMRIMRFVGMALISIGIIFLFLGWLFPNFFIGIIIIGISIGLIIGGGMLIYKNVKEFE